MKSRSWTSKFAPICISAAIGWSCWSVGTLCLAQNAAPGVSPDLQEVVKLSQAKMPDEVIKNYIASTGKSYRLSADDIIYLSNHGVSSDVINTLQTTAPVNPAPATPPPSPTPVATAPAPAPQAGPYVPPPDADATTASTTVEPTPPPPPEVNFQYFHDQLAPYGTWMTVDGTLYWRPDQAIAVDPDWRPYYDMGQWVETENGLYWKSDYTWGDIPFHYGRWILYPGIGWLWAPDYTWGPAWVFWRHDEADGCIGWAPLPVGAVFVDGAFRFHGAVVGADFNFGLGESCFTFVSYDHFHEPFIRMRGREWAWHIDRARLHGFYEHSVIRNDFRRDDHGRFVNYGIGRDRVEHFTRVEHSGFQERNPTGDRNHLRSDDIHRQDNGPGRGQPGGFGNEHSPGGQQPARSAGEGSGFHDQSFGGFGGSPGKVFRPPAQGGPSQRR